MLPSYISARYLQAWKGMLDSALFLKAGWVHDMALHRFSKEKFVVKGKLGTYKENSYS